MPTGRVGRGSGVCSVAGYRGRNGPRCDAGMSWCVDALTLLCPFRAYHPVGLGPRAAPGLAELAAACPGLSCYGPFGAGLRIRGGIAHSERADETGRPDKVARRRRRPPRWACSTGRQVWWLVAARACPAAKLSLPSDKLAAGATDGDRLSVVQSRMSRVTDLLDLSRKLDCPIESGRHTSDGRRFCISPVL